MPEAGYTSVTPSELDWLTEHAIGKKLIIEIGSCYGHSTVALAKGGESVLAVDDFYGPRDLPLSHEERAGIFNIFLDNIKDYPNVVVLRMDHKDYVPMRECDMAFIDGDHAYENVARDISRFLGHKNLLLCGHDYHWWPGVKKAVDELLPGFSLFGDNLWYKQLIN